MIRAFPIYPQCQHCVLAGTCASAGIDITTSSSIH